MKYVFETKEEITHCGNCPFGHEENECTYIACTHPKADPEEYMLDYELINEQPKWCPVADKVVHTLIHETSIDREELGAVKSFAAYQRHLDETTIEGLGELLAEQGLITMQRLEVLESDTIRFRGKLEVISNG